MTPPKKDKHYPAPPSVLRIGYQDIKIIMSDFLDGYGVYRADCDEIRLKEGNSNREMLNTLIHECLHAAFFVYGMKKIVDDDDREEYICNTLGNALTELLTRNPQLAEWICAAAKA